VLEGIKPEVVYFTDNGVGRGALMIIEADSAAQAPHLTEPLMLNFGASVHYRVAIAPAELQSAAWKVRHELTGAIHRHPQEDTCPP
jgi:hypothetical protein